MRRLLIAAVLLATAAALPSTAGARAFSYGVSSAEVTSSSALVWARPLKAGKVQLVLSLDKKFRRAVRTKTVTASKANDLTVQVRVAGLKPGKSYFYFFHQGKQRSLLGTFKTAPKPTAAQTIRFAVTGDADGIHTADGSNIYDKDGAANFATYKAMTREKNDFNVNLGDTIYSDGGGDIGLLPAFDLDGKRQKYRQNLGYAALLGLRQSGSVYNQWDDHEFVDDFTSKSAACDVGSVFNDQFACDTAAIQKAGIKAFREYMPVTYSAKNGTYRSFRWGKNLEVFILDERSFRSLRASEVKDNPAAPEPTTHVCENPAGSGQEDPAPQIPQRIRGLFSLLYPPAGNNARPECLAALNDSKRTMLGSSQYAAFTSAIRNSAAKWKVVINEVPIMEFGLNPYDDWQGYEFEREKLLKFLKASVKNVAFVTTDFHSNWVNDARIKTFPEDGGPIDSGVMEFVAGGVADQTFGKEIDAFTKSPDSWKLIDNLYMDKPPPDGPGMQCSNMVTYGYAQLQATAAKLTVTLKDNKGKQMTNSQDGKPCGPFVLKAK
jgi:phosphodiesterase/alkaline phosphatase D-like protein